MGDADAATRLRPVRGGRQRLGQFHLPPNLAGSPPDAVTGVHVTQLFSPPDGEASYLPPNPEQPGVAELSSSDRTALQAWRFYQHNLASYHHVQADQPQTLAHALADSPAGLLGWNSQCMDGLDPETLLTHVSIHWLTGTAGSALRIYAEAKRPATTRRTHHRPTRPCQLRERLTRDPRLRRARPCQHRVLERLRPRQPLLRPRRLRLARGRYSRLLCRPPPLNLAANTLDLSSFITQPGEESGQPSSEPPRRSRPMVRSDS